VPLLHNLNNETYRKEQGFAEDFRVVQFQVADGDDASCLNLNRVANPRILGVGAAQLEGRFSVQTKIDTVDALNPWAALQMDFGDCVPAIADQTVIQWSFGLKVGDTLFYRNSAGDEVKLKLVAGLAASVFQGNVLIDNSQFQKHFPTYSGSNVFLIDGNLDNKQAIADELLLIYRDLGWEMTETAARLATFKSVENTYLSIFLVMGALGLLLGTIGLAVVLKTFVTVAPVRVCLVAGIGLFEPQYHAHGFNRIFVVARLGGNGRFGNCPHFGVAFGFGGNSICFARLCGVANWANSSQRFYLGLCHYYLSNEGVTNR
jgi:putative ABC transport system permease protein